MRVVHIAKYYPPTSGGMESVTQVLAEGAAGRGDEVDVVCFSRGASTTERAAAVTVQRFHIGFVIASQPLSASYFVAGIRAARRATITHVHAPNVLASAMLFFVGRSTRVVVHWHSDVIGKRLLGCLVRPIERAMLRRADAIIATSPPYAESSRQLHPYRKKVSIIPIGIRAVAPSLEEMIMPADVGAFLRGRALVLAVGRLVKYKGFKYLIEAARALPSTAAVVIVGTGPDHAILRAAIERFSVGDRVMLAGGRPAAELTTLFASAQVFCLPSVERSEAFGVVLLEAMAHGVPCVATTIDGSGTSWVNAHDSSGINVPVRDATALATCIARLLSDRELHNRLSIGGQLRFAQNFSEATFVSAVHALYLRLTVGDVTQLPSR